MKHDYFYTLNWIEIATPDHINDEYMGKDLETARKYAAEKSQQHGEAWINAVSASTQTARPVGEIMFRNGEEVERGGLIAA